MKLLNLITYLTSENIKDCSCWGSKNNSRALIYPTLERNLKSLFWRNFKILMILSNLTMMCLMMRMNMLWFTMLMNYIAWDSLKMWNNYLVNKCKLSLRMSLILVLQLRHFLNMKITLTRLPMNLKSLRKTSSHQLWKKVLRLKNRRPLKNLHRILSPQRSLKNSMVS